ncbi:F-box/LRR-repeat protein 25 [Hordeum vulgare]|nr:F-box/LRR-repeat protein 25 [Hordeum vulgare]
MTTAAKPRVVAPGIRVMTEENQSKVGNSRSVAANHDGSFKHRSSMEDTKPPDREAMAEVGDRFRVMELRSGRLVRRSPPPRRARSRRGPCGGADDRLSALPDDMLLLVLARLRCARGAARTGILSSRWRGLWAHLPDLTFRDVAPAEIEAVLARLSSSPSVPATLDIAIPHTHCTDGAR